MYKKDFAYEALTEIIKKYDCLEDAAKELVNIKMYQIIKEEYKNWFMYISTYINNRRIFAHFNTI